MPVTDAQRRASAKYRKEKVRQLSTRFYPTGDEYELYEFAQSHDNVAGYLKQLIRDDLARTRAEGQEQS